MYVAVLDDKIIGFLALLTQPHWNPIKRVHRLVILPEFQSIGIGMQFLTRVSRLYTEQGWDVTIKSSNPSLIHGLLKHKEWLLINKGHSLSTNPNIHSMNPTLSNQRYTYSFKLPKNEIKK